MKPGQIDWVELPAANGHEQRGRRPAIVLQDEDNVGQLPVVLVVPLTTARGATRFAGTTSIAASSQRGLRTRSTALVFQLRAVDRKRVQNQLGVIRDSELAAVITELDRLMGR